MLKYNRGIVTCDEAIGSVGREVVLTGRHSYHDRRRRRRERRRCSGLFLEGLWERCQTSWSVEQGRKIVTRPIKTVLPLVLYFSLPDTILRQ